MSDKFEYFAVRNAAGLFDTSPLYKYRIAGADAEKFLGGVLARDIARVPRRARRSTRCGATSAATSSRTASSSGSPPTSTSSPRPSRTSPTSRTSSATTRSRSPSVGRLSASLAVQGPRSRDILAGLDPQIATLGYFHHAPAKIGNVPVHVSRTGYTGDLGYEIWVGADGRHRDVGCAVRGVGGPRRAAGRAERVVDDAHRSRPDADRRRLRLQPVRRSTTRTVRRRSSSGSHWMFRDLATIDAALHRPRARSSARSPTRRRAGRWSG